MRSFVLPTISFKGISKQARLTSADAVSEDGALCYPILLSVLQREALVRTVNMYSWQLPRTEA